MANRFWVGGGSANTWAATGNTNWASTSGGANNASVPTTTDVAVFDSNSGSSNSVIGASITVQGLECDGNSIGTGTYAGTITHNTSVTLTINTGAASSFRLTSGMTYTPATATSLVTFTNTSGTAQLKSAGKALFALTINGAGGTVQQQDDLLVNGVVNAVLTLTTGIFDCNSHALTAIQVLASNSNTRSLLLGTSVTLGGNSAVNTTIWNMATTTGLTFTKNSANITVLAPSPNIVGGWIFAGGGLTFNGLTVNQSTVGNALAITGGNTFSSLSVGSGWTIILPNTTLTISSAFTFTGTQARPICLVASTPNTGQATLSVASGTCSLAWGALDQVIGTGGATFTATNTLDFGNNTGWAITPPTDSSSTGIASAVWQDATAGDFTVSNSIGKSLYTTGAVPGAANGLFIAGTNAATSVTTALTANVTGNVSGSVGSVTARVTANTDQIAGNATAATNLAQTTQAIGRGTVTTGASTTSIPTSAYTTATSASVANQLVNRSVLFDVATTTVSLRGQAATITASTASATPTLTVTALTATPASGDTFSVI